MNYKLSEIAAVVGGKFTGCDAEVRSVVTDSRSLSCELGCCPMFVAMRGANHDSHGFVAQMSARGVRAFLVERDVECPADCGFVRVDNAIDALQRLAAHYRAQFRGTVVGITGSNGKTVIKEWIAEELPAGMKYYRSPKSYNSQLGVPLSVLMLEGDEELATLQYIIRDHDSASFEARCNTLRHIEKILNELWGEGTVTLTLTDEYQNMECIIKDHMYLIDYAREACAKANVPEDISPIRGGTDGCKLSFKGLPCPNLGTGGHGYHGPLEHVTIEGMEAAVRVIVELVKIFANE